MARPSSRIHILLWSLFGLIFCLIVLSVTIQSPRNRETYWYESTFFTVLSPFQRAATAVSDSVTQVFYGYLYLVGVQAENRQLKDEKQQLQYQSLLFAKLKDENQDLRRLLDLKQTVPWQSVAADVIAHNPQSEFRMITINRGRKHGIRKRMPVVAADGLVGQVYRVGPNASQVLLITDPTSAVDAQTNDGTARGLIVGRVVGAQLNRDHFLTAMEFIDRAVLVRDGSVVMTTGLDGIFPAGIPIGTVSAVKQNPDGIFKEAQVVPKVDLMVIRQVLVIQNGGS